MKYINLNRLQWAGHVVQTGNIRIKKSYLMENSMEKNCGKTMAEMEIQYQNELLVVAEYRGMVEVSRGQKHLEN